MRLLYNVNRVLIERVIMIKYVPVLKAKLGEFDALNNLSDLSKELIVPLLEVPKDILFKDNDKKDNKNFVTKWCRPFFLDFSYEVFDDSFETTPERLFDNKINWLQQLSTCEVIPVLQGFYSDSYVDYVIENYEDICIRIDKDFASEDDFEQDFKEFLDKFDSKKLTLIIDFKELSNDTNISKTDKIMIGLILSNIEKFASHFVSIVFSSNDFPATLQGIEKYKFTHLRRREMDLHSYAQSRTDIKLVYSDYCVNNWTYFDFIIGMSPSFNIRYTTINSYLCYKGDTMKKQGLRIDKVRSACSELVNSPFYLGEDISWGSKRIFDIANGDYDKPGSNTTWRAIGTNHHIETILKSLSNSL